MLQASQRSSGVASARAMSARAERSAARSKPASSAVMNTPRSWSRSTFAKSSRCQRSGGTASRGRTDSIGVGAGMPRRARISVHAPLSSRLRAVASPWPTSAATRRAPTVSPSAARGVLPSSSGRAVSGQRSTNRRHRAVCSVATIVSIGDGCPAGVAAPGLGNGVRNCAPQSQLVGVAAGSVAESGSPSVAPSTGSSTARAVATSGANPWRVANGS